jgi:hypothetical protein
MALSSCGQKKSLPIKEVAATDGGKYEYILLPKQDSLRWYNPGQDTFKVTVTFAKIANGFPLPDVITEVDNALDEYQPALVYTPLSFAGDNIINPLGWNFSKDQLFNVGHHKNTLSFLQTDGWVEYSFSGYKIEYWAEQFESYGIAGVSIDNGPETMVDLYSPTEQNNSRLVFSADSLSQDNNAFHKIRVRYTHQRNPNANSANARITLDKFVYYWRQPNYIAPPGTATPTQQYEQPKTSNEK